MNEYSLLSDLRDQVRLCFAENCGYQMVITRGKPSAECNLVAFWTGDELDRDFGDCVGLGCEVNFTLDVYIQLIRVCAGPQANVSMDWAAEEAESRCFYADLDRLKCCLRDLNDIRLLQRDFGVNTLAVRDVKKDNSSFGGAYSATLHVVVTGVECCDVS